MREGLLSLRQDGPAVGRQLGVDDAAVLPRGPAGDEARIHQPVDKPCGATLAREQHVRDLADLQVPGSVPAGDPPYTFVTDGIEHAVELARAAAGAKDVSVMGASMVQQCLRAGLLDEMTINLVPVVLGRGVRLLDGLEPGSVEFELVRVVDAPGVTHLTYQWRSNHQGACLKA
jgi:hypothetical protein